MPSLLERVIPQLCLDQTDKDQDRKRREKMRKRKKLRMRKRIGGVLMDDMD